MKKLICAVALMTVGVLSVNAETVTGFVGDSQCKHDGSKGAKDVACSKACIQKKGASPVLMTEGKALKFDAASEEKAKALAGEKVTVEGTVSGDTITVTSIEKAS